jgi:3-hydroxy-5-methyl-1-naphthoate 3-O-methyltransferase
VGGGSGAFDIVLCQRYPELRATVYDLEFVTDIAARNVKTAGLGDRITVTPGDFFADASFPAGHDLHLFSMILHDWNTERGQHLLRKSFDALDSGGTVVICELLVDDDKTGPAPAALMSLNMLIETEGRNYTPAEYSHWLTKAGFVDPQLIALEAPGANGAVTAHKP